MSIKLFISIISIYIFSFQVAFGTVQSRILVKVENQIITNYELKNKILSSLIISGQEINQKNVDSIKKASLDQLIKLKLKKIELKNYKFKKEEAKINSYLNSISANDITGLKKKFEKNDLSFNLFLDEIDTEFKWQKLIYKLYSKKILIDDDYINKEINKIIEEKSFVREFELSEVEINYNLEDSVNEKIEDIYEKIKSYGFENVALNFSSSQTSAQKGYLGWVNEKMLSKDIFKVISKVNIGEISDPIKKQNTILFLKLNNKRLVKSDNIDINKLKENLINKKTNDLFNLYSQSRLSKLQNNSYIQYL